MTSIADVSGKVEISSLGAKGEGLSEGFAVPFTLPGDVIEEGKLVLASDHRATPQCPHFGTCGGCNLQHATDEFVEDWKIGIVEQALRARGLSSKISRVHTSPPRSRRRAVLSGRRTKKTSQIGFFARASEELVPIEECPLLIEQITDSFENLRGITRLAASRKSIVKLSICSSENGLDLSVSDAREIGPEEIGQIAKIAGKFARINWNGEVLLQNTPPFQTFGTARVVPPPGAFLQATSQGEAALLDGVQRAVKGCEKIADLFAGCGTFALPLCGEADVHAVEFEEDMVAAMHDGWRAAKGLRRLTVEARDLFTRPILAQELKNFDAVVLDPPRAGASAQVDELIASDIGHIAYVSCNHVTFARDVARLVEAGFVLEWVEVVDQFRWSHHIELVGCLRRT